MDYSSIFPTVCTYLISSLWLERFSFFIALCFCVAIVGGELSRPAGYPDGPLLRTGLAELPHPAPDRSVPPHIFSENGTLTEFSIAMGIPAF